VVLGGQHSALGAEADGERHSGVGESSTTVAGRGGNELLLQTDSERIRCMGRRLHALRVDAGRQVAHVRAEVASDRQLWCEVVGAVTTDTLSEHAPGAVGLSGATVALGRAQIGAQHFSNYLKTAQIL
jgi:hypothetical protein